MDFLNAGYYGYMKLHAGSDRITRVRWYRAAADAEWFPYPTAFASSIWDRAEWNPPPDPLGEVTKGAWVESGSFTPPPGVEFHGQADWFVNGVPASAWSDTFTPCVDFGNTFCLLQENGLPILQERSPGCIELEH